MKDAMDKTLHYDVECYPNITFIGFLDDSTEEFTVVNCDGSDESVEKIKELITGATIVGYNSTNYDLPMMRACCKGLSPEDLYKVSGKLISADDDPRNKPNEVLGIDLPFLRHFDLKKITYDYKDRHKSLKEWGIELNHPTLRELPYDPHQPVTSEQVEELKRYNLNDLQITKSLHRHLDDEINLRLSIMDEFGVEDPNIWRSKIGKIVLESEYRKLDPDAKLYKKRAEGYQKVSFPLTSILPVDPIFENPEAEEVYQAIRRSTVTKEWDEDAEKPYVREYYTDGDGNNHKEYQGKALGQTFTFGFGGLHTVDGPKILRREEGWIISDFDVASYYPSLMVEYGLVPPSVEKIKFKQVLSKMREQRVAYKKTDPFRATALKIAINSIFGNLGNTWSWLSDPRTFYSVTIGGQVMLLHLADCLYSAGCEIISANTDGVMVRYRQQNEVAVKQAADEWSKNFKMSLERTDYDLLVRKSVNDYFAVSTDGKVKQKGSTFKSDGKTVPIIPKALVEYFVNGTPIEKTIGYGDVYDYLIGFKSSSGFKLYHKNEEVGKIARYYYSTSRKGLYKKKGDRTMVVQKAQSVSLMMDVESPNLPEDIELDQYLDIVRDHIFSIEETRFCDDSGDVAESLRMVGLTPLQQVGKKNPTGVKLSDPDSVRSFSTENVAGLGVVTGKAYKTLCIDVDAPERVPEDTWKILEANPTFTIWRGERNYRGRRKLIYRYSGDDIKVTGPKRSETLSAEGWEAFYGCQNVQVYGLHPSGDEYAFDGCPVDPSPELIEKLRTFYGSKTKRKKPVRNILSDTPATDEELDFDDEVRGFTPTDAITRSDRESEKLRKIWAGWIAEDPDKWLNTLSGWYNEISGEDIDWSTEEGNPLKTTTYCHFEGHSSKVSHRDLTIEFKPDDEFPLKINCWHNSCAEDHRTISNQILSRLYDQARRTLVKPVAEKVKDPTNVDDSLVTIDVGLLPPQLVAFAKGLEKNAPFIGFSSCLYAAITTAGQILGKRVNWPNPSKPTYPNVWTVIIAPSGSSKSDLVWNVEEVVEPTLLFADSTMAGVLNNYGKLFDPKGKNSAEKEEEAHRIETEQRSDLSSTMFLCDETTDTLLSLVGGQNTTPENFHKLNVVNIIDLWDSGKTIRHTRGAQTGTRYLFDHSTCFLGLTQITSWVDMVEHDRLYQKGFTQRFLTVDPGSLNPVNIPDVGAKLWSDLPKALGDAHPDNLLRRYKSRKKMWYDPTTGRIREPAKDIFDRIGELLQTHPLWNEFCDQMVEDTVKSSRSKFLMNAGRIAMVLDVFAPDEREKNLKAAVELVLAAAVGYRRTVTGDRGTSQELMTLYQLIVKGVKRESSKGSAYTIRKLWKNVKHRFERRSEFDDLVAYLAEEKHINIVKPRSNSITIELGKIPLESNRIKKIK